MVMIIGPTGIGKTEYSLSLARSSDAEIICADAFQVYRGMDIGTAKVSQDIRSKIAHHLIDIKNPGESYTVAEFIRLANDRVQDIRKRKKKVIICGGTAFYLNAFLYHFQFSALVKVDEQIRGELELEIRQFGSAALWEKLKKIDSEAADRIKPQDEKRLIRALEIYAATGRPPSESRTPKGDPRKDIRLIGLTASREAIYDRINRRVEEMIASGLCAEVQQLLDLGYDTRCQAFEALGYKETIQYLCGNIGEVELISTIQARTRNFAKRQLTWFRRFPNVQWIDIA